MFNENEIKFDHIKLGDKLGEGGFGTVYKATYLEAEVAVKQIKSEVMTVQAKEEFLKETTLMQQLHHPNIIHFYGASTNPFAIVMEYAPKGSLFRLLHSQEPIELTLDYFLAIGIAKGIHFLHSKNIVHRDLKSPNILLGADNQPKICDFGLAKIKQQSSSTSTAHFKGTMGWAAPELFEDKPAYTPKSDIYAYGMILWELTTRNIPFANTSPMQLMKKLSKGERETIPPNTPDSFKKAIEFSWQEEADKRPSAVEIITLLKEGQQIQAEKTLPKVLKETSADTQKNPQTGPNYLSTLGSMEQSGPNYISVLTSGPNYVSVKNSTKAEISIEVPKDKSEKNQTSTPEPTNFLEETTKLLNAHPWTESQIKYFSETLNTLSFNDPNLQTQLSKEIKLLPSKKTQKLKTHYTFFKQNLPSALRIKIKTLTGHNGAISTLTTLSTTQLASGSYDDTIKIWNLNSGSWTCSQTLTGHTDYVRTLITLSATQLVSGAGDHTIKIWDFKNGSWTCSHTLTGHTSTVYTLTALSATQLASGSYYGLIKIWDLKNGSWTCSHTLTNQFNSWIYTLTAPSTTQLASGSLDHTIKIWDFKNDSWTCSQTLTDHTGQINTLVALSATQLASGANDYTIKIWNLKNGSWTCSQTLEGHTYYVATLIALSATQLASGAYDNTIKIWNLNNGNWTCSHTLTGHTSYVLTLTALSATQLASGAYDNIIKIWDLNLKPTLEELEEKVPECKVM